MACQEDCDSHPPVAMFGLPSPLLGSALCHIGNSRRLMLLMLEPLPVEENFKNAETILTKCTDTGVRIRFKL